MPKKRKPASSIVPILPPEPAEVEHAAFAPPQIDAATLAEREKLMKRDGMLVGIAGVSLINGLHISPFFDPVFFLMRAMAPAFFISSPLLMFYFTSLFLGIATLAIAGVPAAVFERLGGRMVTDTRVFVFWFVGVLVVSLPTLLHLARRSV